MVQTEVEGFAARNREYAAKVEIAVEKIDCAANRHDQEVFTNAAANLST
jgi:hypothetical protein